MKKNKVLLPTILLVIAGFSVFYITQTLEQENVAPEESEAAPLLQTEKMKVVFGPSSDSSRFESNQSLAHLLVYPQKWDYVSRNSDLKLTVAPFFVAGNHITAEQVGEFENKTGTGIILEYRPYQLLDYQYDTYEEDGIELYGQIPTVRTLNDQLIRVLENLNSEGVVVAEVQIDGPFRNILEGNANNGITATLPEVVGLLIESLEELNVKYPYTRFSVLMNINGWDYTSSEHSYGGQHTDEFGLYYKDILTEFYRQNGAKWIDSITIDCPYNFYLQSKDKTGRKSISFRNIMSDIVDNAAKHGLAFNMIVNIGSQPKVFGENYYYERDNIKMITDEGFFKGVIDYMQRLKLDEFVPDTWVVQSWYAFPVYNQPETKDYTLTYTVQKVIQSEVQETSATSTTPLETETTTRPQTTSQQTTIVTTEQTTDGWNCSAFDVNRDDNLTVVDIALFAKWYGTQSCFATNCDRFDANDDGMLDQLDLQIFISCL